MWGVFLNVNGINLYKNYNLYLVRKHAEDICARTLSVQRSEQFSFRPRKTVCFEEPIMSKDKYMSLFSRQMKAIVFIDNPIFLATHAVLKLGEY